MRGSIRRRGDGGCAPGGSDSAGTRKGAVQTSHQPRKMAAGTMSPSRCGDPSIHGGGACVRSPPNQPSTSASSSGGANDRGTSHPTGNSTSGMSHTTTRPRITPGTVTQSGITLCRMSIHAAAASNKPSTPCAAHRVRTAASAPESGPAAGPKPWLCTSHHQRPTDAATTAISIQRRLPAEVSPVCTGDSS